MSHSLTDTGSTFVIFSKVVCLAPWYVPVTFRTALYCSFLSLSIAVSIYPRMLPVYTCLHAVGLNLPRDVPSLEMQDHAVSVRLNLRLLCSVQLRT